MTLPGDGVRRIYGTVNYTDTGAAVVIGVIPAYCMLTGIHAHQGFAGGSADWSVVIGYNATGDAGGLFLTLEELDPGEFALSPEGGYFSAHAFYSQYAMAFTGLFSDSVTPTTSGSAIVVATYVLLEP